MAALGSPLTIRNKEFQASLRRIPRTQILGIAIDAAKNTHRVLLFDFHGTILAEPFSIDVFESGYGQLRNTGEKTVRCLAVTTPPAL